MSHDEALAFTLCLGVVFGWISHVVYLASMRQEQRMNERKKFYDWEEEEGY